MATAKITNETMVECKNGTHGNLFYASTRNPGYTVEWTEFGEVQEMDYAELLVMRGSQPRFFRDKNSVSEVIGRCDSGIGVSIRENEEKYMIIGGVEAVDRKHIVETMSPEFVSFIQDAYRSLKYRRK